MASSALPPFLLLILALSAFSATARPCKTIFFYTITTTTTTSYFPTHHHLNNPNISPKFTTFQNHLSDSPKFLTLFFTSVNSQDAVSKHNSLPLRFYFPTEGSSLRSYPFPRFVDHEVEENRDQQKSVVPEGFYSSMTRGSIKDRTKDIMSVVAAMLFGVGCGALTAATMYLVWCLTSRFASDEEEGFDGEYYDDDEASPKKVGYVVIPDDDIDAIKKAAQAQAKKMEADGN